MDEAANVYRFVVVLDDEDQQALKAIAEAEKLTRSDTVRRLIRAQYRRINAERGTETERATG